MAQVYFIKTLVLFIVGTAGIEWCTAGSCGTPNVRTVLFSEDDLKKQCWTREEIALVFTRFLMQQLLPEYMPDDMGVMSEYILSTFYDTTGILADQPEQSIILKGISDTFGGYLQTYMIPLANEAFYEGNCTMSTVVNIHSLQRDIKKIVDTDGSGWPRPIIISRTLWPVSSLMIKCPRKVHHCDGIMFHPKVVNETKADKCAKCLQIPMPVFDDNQFPHAIAVPLTDAPALCSLFSSASQGVLQRYYQKSICCIREISKSTELCCKREAKAYNEMFREWLKNSIIVHLHEQEYYPAFGGVIQIMKTVNDQIRFGDPELNISVHSVEQIKIEAVTVPFCIFAAIILCLKLRKCLNKKISYREEDPYEPCDIQEPYLVTECDCEGTEVNKQVYAFSYDYNEILQIKYKKILQDSPPFDYNYSQTTSSMIEATFPQNSCSQASSNDMTRVTVP